MPGVYPLLKKEHAFLKSEAEDAGIAKRNLRKLGLSAKEASTLVKKYGHHLNAFLGETFFLRKGAENLPKQVISKQDSWIIPRQELILSAIRGNPEQVKVLAGSVLTRLPKDFGANSPVRSPLIKAFSAVQTNPHMVIAALDEIRSKAHPQKKPPERARRINIVVSHYG